MRFMMIVKATKDSEAGTPPNPKLMAAVAKLAEEASRSGVMVGAGGLLPSSQGARIRVSGGKTSVIDGPFAETKELVGGYAIFDLKSKEEAIQMGTHFMQIHGDVLGPSYEGELEIRPMFGAPSDGAKQLNSYLHFNGQCEDAFKFYEQCLGAKIVTMLTHGDSPVASEVPLERRNQVLHASLTIGNETLMGCDTPPEHYQKPQGFSVALHVKDPKEAERKFHALAEDGTVQMPLQETFWSVRFGMVVDRFGIPWMVNCEQAA